MEKIIITITGDLGSGKSTVSKMLAESLGVDYYSSGSALRDVAKTRDISILELNRLAEKDPSIDKEIDSVFANLKQSSKSLVVDSRMAWFFLPDSIKVKLTVSPIVAAQRIHADTGRVSEDKLSVEETLQATQERRKSEQVRFQNYYGVNSDDDKNFDFIIDTTALTPQQVVTNLRALIAVTSRRHFVAQNKHKLTTPNNGE